MGDKMKYELMQDSKGEKIQVYVPVAGKTIPLGTYSPEKDEVVMLGVEVAITIDTVPLTYPINFVIGLDSDKTYTFSVDTPVHTI